MCLKRLLLPPLIAGSLLFLAVGLLPPPPALAQPSHTTAVFSAPLAAITATSASVYTYSLTSENVAAIELSATAGELFVSTLLLCLLAAWVIEMIFRFIYRQK